ncbi:Asr1405/Asl0597 family protein [Altericista sp. CCNU0014]|uniref:Asr1405/Asl0597 family protein n=1 Tax=Altericista sp. CCNU0014 TaxID=3082949 RepID=UPI00384E9684
MNSGNLPARTDDMMAIQCGDRWMVYQRLQELNIFCSCSYYQPLTVRVSTATAAIQVWSVLRQANASRSTLAKHLERCWQARTAP